MQSILNWGSSIPFVYYDVKCEAKTILVCYINDSFRNLGRHL